MCYRKWRLRLNKRKFRNEGESHGTLSKTVVTTYLEISKYLDSGGSLDGSCLVYLFLNLFSFSEIIQTSLLKNYLHVTGNQGALVLEKGEHTKTNRARQANFPLWTLKGNNSYHFVDFWACKGICMRHKLNAHYFSWSFHSTDDITVALLSRSCPVVLSTGLCKWALYTLIPVNFQMPFHTCCLQLVPHDTSRSYPTHESCSVCFSIQANTHKSFCWFKERVCMFRFWLPMLKTFVIAGCDFTSVCQQQASSIHWAFVSC